MIRIIVLLLISLLLFSCTGNSQDKKKNEQSVNETLMRMNRMVVENESKKINDFIAAQGFNTKMTGSGLRYEIYVSGNGSNPAANDKVSINYKVYLLDGTLCYTNDSLNPLTLQLGADEQVRGLEEGILLMSTGDKARLILPAHLAYGREGDQNKIPPSNALYYDIELLQIIK